MNREQLIPLSHFCEHYHVEMTFFRSLNEVGLIEIVQFESFDYIHEHESSALEKIIRMHHELEINLEGIETVLHLLSKIETLQKELITAKNKLRLYED